MPWVARDAPSHTHRADTPGKRRQWSAVANRVLAETANEGRAIRIANAAVKRSKHRRKRKRSQ